MVQSYFDMLLFSDLFAASGTLIFKGFSPGVGIIPKFRDGDWEWLSGYALELLSLKACTNPGVAKRTILSVLFIKEKNYFCV